MKRVASLLLMAFLAFNSVGLAQADSPTTLISSPISKAPPLLRPPTMDLAIPGKNARCTNVGPTRICVSVSNPRPAPRTFVTVYGMVKRQGVGQPGQIMTVTWRSNGVGSCVAVTDSQGMAACTAYFAGAAKGHIVRVKVTIDKYKLATHFTSKTDQAIQQDP
jgi:hypothetical protein